MCVCVCFCPQPGVFFNYLFIFPRPGRHLLEGKNPGATGSFGTGGSGRWALSFGVAECGLPALDPKFSFRKADSEPNSFGTQRWVFEKNGEKERGINP